jgi:vitamin B12 transporter
MDPIFPLFAAAIAVNAPPVDVDTIVVTAARDERPQNETPASTSIINGVQIEALGVPLTVDLLRLEPGIAVATSGPAGSQTQVRIRGAEANHSLLFVDGIKFNDPASGNEARFELLTNDGLARIEVLRGPQSALWGSEALGGVIAVDTPDPRTPHAQLFGEYGSLESGRVAAAFTSGGKTAIGAAASWLRSDGIDAFGNPGPAAGDRDGFKNGSASLQARFQPSAAVAAGLVGHWISGTSQFDGFEDFQRADTRDSSRNRIVAGRSWARISWGDSPAWTLDLDASLLDSANHNRLAGEPQNRSSGRRTTAGAQLNGKLLLGATSHSLAAAIEHEVEVFDASDEIYFGATDQHQKRRLTGLAGEWRADWSSLLASDVSVRHDAFSAFADVTTLRASLLLRPSPHWRLHAAYGEGIAQPTFYDLFGFFPGFFVGNPALRPERSNALEAGLRWFDDRTSASITGFSARLHDEIVDTFDPVTFLSSTANAEGTSRRRGIEFEATRTIDSKGLISLSYTFLSARERQAANGLATREVRRPRHSGSAAVTLPIGPVLLGASIAYVGARIDTDFDFFPGRRVRLGDYWLGSLNLAWRISDRIELRVRMENGFDAQYEDVVGYATAGRTVYAGFRLHRSD